MLEFLKEEWFTILSIILSGAISWGISAIYFYKGNRSSLQSAIIIPLITITNEPVTRKNYAEVKDISRSPLTRFFHKDEKRNFLSLLPNTALYVLIMKIRLTLQRLLRTLNTV